LRALKRRFGGILWVYEIISSIVIIENWFEKDNSVMINGLFYVTP